MMNRELQAETIEAHFDLFLEIYRKKTGMDRSDVIAWVGQVSVAQSQTFEECLAGYLEIYCYADYAQALREVI